jgi:hypothetical protein
MKVLQRLGNAQAVRDDAVGAHGLIYRDIMFPHQLEDLAQIAVDIVSNRDRSTN